MTLEELKEALLAADPAAVLVSPHLLARVIREVHHLPAQTLGVPHRKSLILDRGTLFRHVEPDDLDLGPDRMLPPTIILLSRPPALERRNALEREATLRTYWRRLFHANVHLALQKRIEEGELGPEDLAARIQEIGATEFDEIRAVLRDENYLFPDADDQAVYLEFAAVYLDLRYFLPDLPPVYFPAIRDFERIDRLLARDVDAPALFRRMRLAGASDPARRPDHDADEPSDACVKLIRDARKAARAGNAVRAAILRTRAARIAPAALTIKAEADAHEDLQLLTGRLQTALKLTDTEAREWLDDLLALLDKASEGEWSVEARLLYDLQKACTEHERDVFALDLVEWALSFGKRPIKRPLPSQRIVRVLSNLRSAVGLLSSTRLSETARQHLGRLLHDALSQGEERLRARFRPVLSDAMLDVGLRASNPPEQTAFQKTIEELLDRILDIGFFTYSDLRDAISRNNLKLPDLHDARELVRGDPILQLDRLLGTALDGVYRPSEVYLRLLQKFTAPQFGTRLGRWVTRYVTLPFGGALLALEAIDWIFQKATEYFGGVYKPVFGPLSVLSRWLKARREPTTYSLPVYDPEQLYAPVLLALLGLFLVCVINSATFRRELRRLGAQTSGAIRWLFYDLPAGLVPWPMLRSLLKSWPFQLFYGILLLPILFSLLLWRLHLFPDPFENPWRAAGIFLALEIIFNSRPAHAAGDAFTRGGLRIFEWLRSGLLPGLVRLIVRLFKQITDGVEYVLYSVDEWLRFRSGDRRVSMIVRAILGVIWFPVSYLTRLYLVVLIEPGLNPLKLPISILAAKFLYPITLTFGWPGNFEELLAPVVGGIAAKAIAVSTWWLLPDAFGFLFWEMKENWRLYKANRRKFLSPVSVGTHGETVLQLLKPGFHTGTLPKLYAQWRYAGRQAYQTGAWRAARACREALAELEESLRRFVEREALVLLHQNPHWRKRPLHVGDLSLASNVIRINLRHADFPDKIVSLAIAEREGRLLATLEEPGWSAELSPEEQRTLARALDGLYNLAGVDWVTEADAPPSPIKWKNWVKYWSQGEGSDAATELPLAEPVLGLKREGELASER
jgi:hypothetical protein